MQIDVFLAYANQNVEAMIMAIAVYGRYLAGIQQLSFYFPSQQEANTFTEEINRYFRIVGNFFFTI
ncbi:hypothetical protein [Nostoc sp.]|uniref:hypothetical protein n=1 Tax=Nostoc sp. TaxID=1180 RepID=UPI002FF8DD4B